MDWNSPWIVIRIFAVIIFFIFAVTYIEAKVKEPDPRRKQREEEEARRAEAAEQKRRFKLRRRL